VLDARLGKRRGGFLLDVAFQAGPGSTTVLVGESGAGKTSVLRLLAGLDRPAHGVVTVDGRPWVDTERALLLPPWRRDVGYVPQDYALFPHLSVEQNVAFGLGDRRLPPAIRRERVRGALATAGVAELGRRQPRQLSGGEQQRVALARALAPAPRLLLLDEPLASLDAARKAEIMPYFERLRDEAQVPMVYVSHDADEVRRLATRVVLLENGRVTAAGGVELLP
jgi:molybdate transport system ATP-binding protein